MPRVILGIKPLTCPIQLVSRALFPLPTGPHTPTISFRLIVRVTPSSWNGRSVGKGWSSPSFPSGFSVIERYIKKKGGIPSLFHVKVAFLNRMTWLESAGAGS